MTGSQQTSSAEEARLERFRTETERFLGGEISAAEYRAYRVPQGVYEQRRDGTYMLRTRCPGGGLSPLQLRAMAAVSNRFGNGILHVTTRQDVQIHSVVAEDLPGAQETLSKGGLSTLGGGGNTVRNISACCDAGI